ncbi:hypothetical protein [Sphaerochaeta globosa]|uniref:Uncharacterized protein n=1 Tax=Sphaerochaeta globosa (strain ATCC BAA-1886 / DSM 22777 / Buddy) TaxID=158189 RepID=F0RWQ7_SPHGB|nr:hypothetical protein [Sphaerochaeta globosa]ADY13688.1 hypothetical protein SpiBuddy_1864 [Sphaerochaeta globosa str. Buddy]
MNQLVNNWMYGEISPKLGGRLDLEMNTQGCEILKDFRNMLQGGITRRPPLKHVAQTVRGRTIPFTLSSGESFLVELSNKKLRVWRKGVLGFYTVTFLPSGNDYLPTDYLEADVWSIQYAQYYDRLYLVHKDYQPHVVVYAAEAFQFSPFTAETDAGKQLGKSTGYYPSVVGICQNRLWFSAAILKPYTTWVSRPPYDGSNNHHDFTTFDVIEVNTEVIKDPSTWPKTTNEQGDEMIDFSDSSKFVETVKEIEEVINAKCAMEIELASGRNDTIKWVAGMDNIFIGTEANEWMCPFDIDPTKQSASMLSSYGSLPIQPQTLHDGIFFLQRGNRLREMTRSQNGSISNDLSFTADHILFAGIRQLATLKNPDPMIFCLLNDGTLAVLCYDKNYGMQGWSRWSTQGEFMCLAPYEDEDGQKMFAHVRRGNDYSIEYFDFEETEFFEDRHGEALHGNLAYQSLMVGNRFDFNTDAGPTIGKSKKTKEVWVRCLDSGRLKAGVDEEYMQQTAGPVGSEDYRIYVSGGSRKELRTRIESVGSDPLTLLAMTYNVEVN